MNAKNVYSGYSILFADKILAYEKISQVVLEKKEYIFTKSLTKKIFLFKFTAQFTVKNQISKK